MAFDESLKEAVQAGQASQMPGITPGITPGKMPERILALLRAKPDLSTPELASSLGKSVSAVERAIRKLRVARRLERIGPAKGGQWKVLDGQGSGMRP